MFGEKYVVLLNFKIYNTQPVVFTAQPLRPFRGVCLDRRLGWTGAVTLLIRACFKFQVSGRGGVETIMSPQRNFGVP
tara:strand:+ start:281 stop:511 length:231 start_codon:yes stop_codon:yes gene_type:complete